MLLNSYGSPYRISTSRFMKIRHVKRNQCGLWKDLFSDKSTFKVYDNVENSMVGITLKVWSALLNYLLPANV